MNWFRNLLLTRKLKKTYNAIIILDDDNTTCVIAYNTTKIKLVGKESALYNQYLIWTEVAKYDEYIANNITYNIRKNLYKTYNPKYFAEIKKKVEKIYVFDENKVIYKK